MNSLLNVNINSICLKKKGVETGLLSNIRFQLVRESIFTILGKNGMGKTTLAKALTGLLDTSFYSVDGEVSLEGRNILALPNDELLKTRKDKIRYIFQDAISCFDPLKKMGYYFRDSADRMDKVENLLEFFRLPGFNNLGRLYPFEISGGMAQRVSFVLALLSDPGILILDEPTSSLDAASINLVMLKLNEFTRNGGGVLLITQDIDLALAAGGRLGFLVDKTLHELNSAMDFMEAKEDSPVYGFLEAYKLMQDGKGGMYSES